jgi:hypothetical protein
MRTGRPSCVSSAWKLPVPASKRPITGTSIACRLRASSHQIAQVPRRIEGAQRDRAIVAVGQKEEIVLDIAVAAEQRALLAGAGECLPFGAAGQACLEAAVLHAPASLLEIEIGAMIVMRQTRGARFAWNVARMFHAVKRGGKCPLALPNLYHLLDPPPAPAVGRDEADARGDDARALILRLDVHPVDDVALDQALELLDKGRAGLRRVGRDIRDILGIFAAAQLRWEEPGLHQSALADELVRLGLAGDGVEIIAHGHEPHPLRRGGRNRAKGAEQEQGSGQSLPCVRHCRLPMPMPMPMPMLPVATSARPPPLARTGRRPACGGP